MDNEVVKLRSCKLTYCHVCGFPAPCGEFELMGWHHVVYICGRCLERLSRDVMKLAGGVLQETTEEP